MSRLTSNGFRLQTGGVWSGGGLGLVRNFAYAAERYPEILSLDGPGLPLILRNAVAGPLLASGRFVYVPQNAWAWRGPSGTRSEIARRIKLRAVSELALLRAARMIRVSDAIPGRRAPDLPALYNVIDREFEPELEASRSMGSMGEDAIVSVGSVATYRNLGRLLAAYEAYRRSGGRYRLVIRGHADSPALLARLRAKVAGRPDISIETEISRAEVLALFRDCRLAIFPSFVECAPLGLLEALATAPRVAASAIPGHRGIAAGMMPDGYFDPRSVEAMTAALRAADGAPPADPPAQLATPEAREALREAWSERLRTYLRALLA